MFRFWHQQIRDYALVQMAKKLIQEPALRKACVIHLKYQISQNKEFVTGRAGTAPKLQDEVYDKKVHTLEVATTQTQHDYNNISWFVRFITPQGS